MRQVESSHVVAGVLEVIRARRRPRLHFVVELLRAHNQRFAPALSALGPPAKRDAYAVDAQPREPLDRLQHGVVVPSKNLIGEWAWFTGKIGQGGFSHQANAAIGRPLSSDLQNLKLLFDLESLLA